MVTLKPDLQRIAECIPLERLGEPLTDAEQAHLTGCTRCEAELSLWQSFGESKPGEEDGAAVQWIVAELRRRAAGKPAPAARPQRGWLANLGWRPALGLATIVLAATSVYLVWDPEPRVRTPVSATQTYRTTAVTIVAPRGDIAAPPAELSWVATDGAVRYSVEVLEIDKMPLWSTTSTATRLALPRALVDRIVPGKTLLWTVTAFDRSDRPIAESGFQSFRVSVAPGSGRD